MDRKSFKSLKTSNGHTYSYYSSPASDGKPTLLLIHGFPDTAVTCYSHQVPHFQSQGLGIIAPSILGYPGTSCPTDKSEYVGSKIATSILSILDEEKVDKVVVVGHDWGSQIASRFALLAPERTLGVVLTCVGAPNPTQGKYDLSMIRTLTESVLGYPTTGYVEAMVEESEGAGFLKDTEAKESFRSLIYPVDGDIWMTDLLPTGKCKEWVTSRKSTPLASWLTPEDKEEYHSLDFAFITKYYAALVQGDMDNDTESNEALQKPIPAPTLLLLAKKDKGCPPIFWNQPDGLKATYADVDVQEFDSTHWMIREKEAEWRGAVEKFMKDKSIL